MYFKNVKNTIVQKEAKPTPGDVSNLPGFVTMLPSVRSSSRIRVAMFIWGMLEPKACEDLEEEDVPLFFNRFFF